MPIVPYLMFEGRCEEAIEFYKKALGAEVGMLMRFKENPDPGAPGCDEADGRPPVDGEKIMHCALQIGGGTIMASDGMASGRPDFRGISLTLDASDEADAERKFKALADGGQVQMPLGKTFFARSFGMVADRFGVSWMVIAAP